MRELKEPPSRALVTPSGIASGLFGLRHWQPTIRWIAVLPGDPSHPNASDSGLADGTFPTRMVPWSTG